MRYVEARIDDDSREEAYRIYVTRSLQLAPRGESLVKSYHEIVLDNKDEEPKDAYDVVVETMKKGGLKFGGT